MKLIRLKWLFITYFVFCKIPGLKLQSSYFGALAEMRIIVDNRIYPKMSLLVGRA